MGKQSTHKIMISTPCEDQMGALEPLGIIELLKTSFAKPQ
jgi:hypothetical protein